MIYENYLEKEELKDYRNHVKPSLNDMLLENIIIKDIHLIGDEVGGQFGMYKSFPISRVYKNDGWTRVYCLDSEGGVVIIRKPNEFMQIITLGEDDANFFIHSSDLHQDIYGKKQSFVWLVSEAISLFNNIE